MRGFMGSEAEDTEEGRVKKPKGMPRPLAWILLAMFAAVPLGNLAFGVIQGVMLGGSRYSGQLVHWHGQPILFSIAFGMSSFLVGAFTYVLIIAMRNAAKAKREAQAGRASDKARV